MVDMWISIMVTFIISQRLLELYIAKKNYKRVLAAGAQEFGSKHYPLFFILHVGWLMSWIGEGCLLGNLLSEIWYIWLSIFITAQGLRYWCIVSLGQFWNTRILVIPGKNLIDRGPYRFIQHPNYLAIAMELVSVPLIFGATVTAGVATIMNAWLLLGIRIPEEEKALKRI